MHWREIVHFGDIEQTVAIAVAITVWLVAARASRMAFWWSLLFTLGIGLVGLNKIAFMAWGITLHVLDFKAISGHASGFTAVAPTLFYLLLCRRSARVQVAGVGAGMMLGALMAVLLVIGNDHSTAEALVGWITGVAISLTSIRLGGVLPPRLFRPSGLRYSLLAFAATAGLMHIVPHGWLMVRTAALISRI